MINLMFISIYSLFSLHVANSDSLDIKFKKAYDFISTSEIIQQELLNNYKNVDDLRIGVSDEIVSLPYSFFYKEIFQYGLFDGEKTEAHIRDSLIAFDYQNQFEPYDCKKLNRLSKDRNDKPELILYFSKVIGRSLLAEIFIGENPEKAYKSQKMFNRSVLFLFYFDEKNEIEHVFTRSLLYN